MSALNVTTWLFALDIPYISEIVAFLLFIFGLLVVVLYYILVKKPENNKLKSIYESSTKNIKEKYHDYCFYHPPSSITIISDDGNIEKMKEITRKIKDLVKRQESEIIIVKADDTRERELKILKESVKYLGEKYSELIYPDFLCALRNYHAIEQAKKEGKFYLIEKLMGEENEYASIIDKLEQKNLISQIIFPMASDILKCYGKPPNAIFRRWFRKIIEGLDVNIGVAHFGLNRPLRNLKPDAKRKSYIKIGEEFLEFDKNKDTVILTTSIHSKGKSLIKMMNYTEAIKEKCGLKSMFSLNGKFIDNDGKTEIPRFWNIISKNRAFILLSRQLP